MCWGVGVAGGGWDEPMGMDLGDGVLTGEELQGVVQEEAMGGIETVNRFRKRWSCIRSAKGHKTHSPAWL